MKIGLIARDEIARGIAIQSRNFYDHMPVDRVLLVRMRRRDCDVADNWYQNATIVTYDETRHELPELVVQDWLRGLDVVFTVETPNDWRIPMWCKNLGVKLVIQGNPEFYRHGQPGSEHLPHPDEWWWPTSWRMTEIGVGRLMPVPMPDDVPNVADTSNSVLSVVHVIGKRAHADRNGTDLFINALRAVRAPIHVTMFSIDGHIPEARRQPNLSIDYFPWGTVDPWDLYVGHHILCLPRAYGGLCLPALEAAASGLAVMMPDISPNGELASILVPVRRTRALSMPCGIIQAAVVNHLDLGFQLDALARNLDRVLDAMSRQGATANVPRWSVWRKRYLDRFEELCE